MNVRSTGIPEVLVVEPRVFGDSRGFFFESFNRKAFEAAVGRSVDFVQDNHSLSARNVLRGPALPAPAAAGEARARRPRRGVRRRGGPPPRVAELRPLGGRGAVRREQAAALDPEGFAHGFLVRSDEAEFLYKTTDYWHPEHERCIRWDDPKLAIRWPLEGASPIVSAKDAAGAAGCPARPCPTTGTGAPRALI